MGAVQAKPNIEITQRHWDIVRAILARQLAGYEVWAFGSRARHTAKPYSDLDLVVITNQPLSLNELAPINEAFEESDLPWKVDLVDWATTSELFREIIQHDKVVVQ